MAVNLTEAEKEAVATFRELTETSEETAIVCLASARYRVQVALEYYYENPDQFVEEQPEQQQPEPMQPPQQMLQPVQPIHQVVQPLQPVQPAKKESSRVRKLFDMYANDPKDTDTPGKIGPNGMLRLLTDLKLDCEDRRVLILAYKMDAKVMSEFSWEEWKKGMLDMGVESRSGLRKKLKELDEGLETSGLFKPLYQFAFDYGKTEVMRYLEMETAIIYWKILFRDQFALLGLWEEYLQKEYAKPIPRDTWHMIYNFSTKVKADLSDFDVGMNWPMVINKFVDWARPRLEKAANQ